MGGNCTPAGRARPLFRAMSHALWRTLITPTNSCFTYMYIPTYIVASNLVERSKVILFYDCPGN